MLGALEVAKNQKIKIFSASYQHLNHSPIYSNQLLAIGFYSLWMQLILLKKNSESEPSVEVNIALVIS